MLNKISWLQVLKGGLLVLLTITFTRGIFVMINSTLHKNRPVDKNDSLMVMTRSELKRHDGSDNSLPIYLAYEGKIYDVSEGREYYKTGGVYHYLAGKDSTVELNMVGGAIIKRKYPVIGRLE